MATQVARRNGDFNQGQRSTQNQPGIAGPAQPQLTMEPVERTVPLFRPILDLALLVLAWVPVILLNSLLDPFNRGFYCADESIRYPYKDDTVKSWVNYAVGGAIVLVVILIMESIFSFTQSGGRRVKYVIKGKAIPMLLSSVFVYAGYCLIGFTITQTTTDVCKVLVGRLRPHFIDVCKPDWAKLESFCAPGSHLYIEEPFCQTNNSHRLRDARVSFLSGHSSYASYMMVFAALYIHSRWRWSSSSIVIKYVIQVALLFYGLFVGLSRMSDYKHHWSDVLSGFALGTLVACLTTIHFGKFFQRDRYQTEQTPLSPTSQYYDDARPAERGKFV